MAGGGSLSRSDVHLEIGDAGCRYSSGRWSLIRAGLATWLTKLRTLPFFIPWLYCMSICRILCTPYSVHSTTCGESLTAEQRRGDVLGKSCSEVELFSWSNWLNWLIWWGNGGLDALYRRNSVLINCCMVVAIRSTYIASWSIIIFLRDT